MFYIIGILKCILEGQNRPPNLFSVHTMLISGIGLVYNTYFFLKTERYSENIVCKPGLQQWGEGDSKWR